MRQSDSQIAWPALSDWYRVGVHGSADLYNNWRQTFLTAKATVGFANDTL